MSEPFFEQPILNSPYVYPARHWELDDDGQPTHRVIESRRPAQFITPVPKPKRRSGGAQQQEFTLDEGKGISTEEQRYDPQPVINRLRQHIDAWRELPECQWKVTPETARLLRHWRNHRFAGYRPFFCQIEAVETVIYLTEVAPKSGKSGETFFDYLERANADANPELDRVALKLATGAGKTTVMAMIIAWQTINAVRRPNSNRFTRGFLVVTPGITIRDRLQVLKPNDPYSYYASRELVPTDMLEDLQKARIVITNYHAFKLRDIFPAATGTKKLLQGHGAPIETTETPGQMMKRVMPELMGMKNILVLNDEAHHCYREKPQPEAGTEAQKLKGDERAEAQSNNEAARLWISGLEMVTGKIGVRRVVDLSATPFFLRGSGYAEGTLFPWTMSDFSLMDAIESGIVKLPRVPVSDNIPGAEIPKFRNLWDHIGKKMPKKGRGKAKGLDPLSLPVELQTALEAIYGHYEKTHNLWSEAGVRVPPCFIIVCNNTATSKLVYDYIAGFHRKHEDGTKHFQQSRFPLLRNFDDDGSPVTRPRTILIDSEQLESGEALDRSFRDVAANEIERFRRETVERGGTGPGDNGEFSDADILREVMNTVGKEGRLGESIRCVVSVSMLTEGWDANTVTHVLGVRAFGTQLLCEQVVGRALRRQSYDVNEEGLFNVEYADVLGIPFDFTAKPVPAPPQPPRETVTVQAVRPERDALEITFPRVQGYRIDLPEERLEASFSDESVLTLTPEMTGPSKTKNQGIIGEGVDLDLIHTAGVRRMTIIYHIAHRLLLTKWRDPSDEPKIHLFGQLKRITREWLDRCLVCQGGTYPAQLLFGEIGDLACEKITAAITSRFVGEHPVKAVLDPYNPTGSTRHVQFTTSKTERFETDPRRSHINWVILDSGWEGEFCRVVEANPQVLVYVKNQSLGFEVPYRFGSELHHYIPDFIVLIDDGAGRADPLHLVVEIKGYRGESAKEKKAAMESYWIPGVNNLGTYGRWAFAEFRDVFDMEEEFGRVVSQAPYVSLCS